MPGARWTARSARRDAPEADVGRRERDDGGRVALAQDGDPKRHGMVGVEGQLDRAEQAAVVPRRDAHRVGRLAGDARRRSRLRASRGPQAGRARAGCCAIDGTPWWLLRAVVGVMSAAAPASRTPCSSRRRRRPASCRRIRSRCRRSTAWSSRRAFPAVAHSRPVAPESSGWAESGSAPDGEQMVREADPRGHAGHARAGERVMDRRRQRALRRRGARPAGERDARRNGGERRPGHRRWRGGWWMLGAGCSRLSPSVCVRSVTPTA